MTMTRLGRILALAATGLALAATAAHPQPAPTPAVQPATSYETLLTPVFSGGSTIINQPIAYPAGAAPLVTTAIVTLPPGGETGWHSHPVPLFVYVLEGTITVDYGTQGTHTYTAGQGFLEAMNWPHNGMNRGDVPVRILAVYIGAEGVANATAAAGAQ